MRLASCAIQCFSSLRARLAVKNMIATMETAKSVLRDFRSCFRNVGASVRLGNFASSWMQDIKFSPTGSWRYDIFRRRRLEDFEELFN
jgi:hypothetical protein